MPFQRAIIGYDLDGKLDTDFADSGKLILPPPFGPFLSEGFPIDWFRRCSVAVDSEFRLYALGRGSSTTGNDDPDSVDLFLGRFDDDGALDAAYGESGVVNLSEILGSSVFRAWSVRAIAPDRSGRLLLALDFWKAGNYISNALVRLTADGQRDDAFEPFVPSNASPHNFINDVAIDERDRVVVLLGPQWPDFTTWRAPETLTPTYKLRRLEPDGAPESSNTWDPAAGDMWADRANEPTAVHGAWSIAVEDEQVFAWGSTENGSSPTDRASTFLHRFGADGLGDKAWFDNSLRDTNVNGWSNAPTLQEESWNKRLLVRSGGLPVTYGEPHPLYSAKEHLGFVFYMKSDGSALGPPMYVRDEIVDAVLVNDDLVGLLCQRNGGMRLHGVKPGSLLADWGSDSINRFDLRANPFEIFRSAERDPSRFGISDRDYWTVDELADLRRRLDEAEVIAFEWDGTIEPINFAKSSTRLFAAVLLEVVDS